MNFCARRAEGCVTRTIARATYTPASKPQPRLKRRTSRTASCERANACPNKRAFASIAEVERPKHNRVVKKRCWRDNSRPFLLAALRVKTASANVNDMPIQEPAQQTAQELLQQPALTLRPALADDEAFLFELRKATMTEHLVRAGEPTDDAEHRARLLHRYDAARVICIDGAPAGLLKAHRTDTEWVVVQLQIAPALRSGDAIIMGKPGVLLSLATQVFNRRRALPPCPSTRSHPSLPSH